MKIPALGDWFKMQLRQLTRSNAARLVLGWSILVTVVWHTPTGDSLNRMAAHQAEFQTRVLLGKEPALDKRIKIIVLDDQTFYTTGQPSLHEWALLIKELSNQKPRAIFIDKLFNRIEGGDKQSIAEFNESLSTISTPVYAGLYIIPQTIQNRQAVQPDDVASPRIFDRTTRADLTWFGGTQTSNAYGPDTAISGAFATLGSITVADDGNFAYPVWRAKNLPIIPHFGLLAAEKIEINDDSVVVDGVTIPLNRDGKILINLPSAQSIETKHPYFFRLKPFIEYVRQNKPIRANIINPGDVIFIIPGGYSGSSDFVNTSFGNIPGGYTHIAIINSVLTGRWLHLLGGSLFIILAAGLIGGIGTAFLRPAAGFGFFIISVGGLISSSLYLFSFHNVVVPWLGSAIAFSGSSFLVFFDRARSLEIRAQRISATLEGLVSSKLMRSLLRNPNTLSFSAVSVDVSIMFVDISDFSVSTRDQTPELVFEQLKSELAAIARIILDHDGIIDKTLGDGLLCFFGYSYDQGASTKNHALTAIECATSIQQDSATRIVQARSSGEIGAIFPLRIGINSGLVHLGNLGSDRRIDLTVIGNTVNLAKRYEDACESLRILIGRSTFERLGSSDNVRMMRRFVMPKHYIELWEAWEISPLADLPQLEGQVRWAMRGLSTRARRAERFEIPDSRTISVRIGRQYEYNGHLKNFSASGLLVECDVFLSRKVEIPLVINSADPALRNNLIEHEILPIMTVVRWGMPLGTNYLLGLEILNLNTSQRETLVEILVQYLGTSGMPPNSDSGSPSCVPET